MVKAIFFDLDDTLLWDEKSIQFALQKTIEEVAKKYDLDSKKFEKIVREEAEKLYASYETYEFTKMIGINPFEGLWGDFLDEGDGFQQLSKIVPTYRKQVWTNGLKQFGIDDPIYGEWLANRFREERKKHPFVYDDTFPVLNELEGKYDLLLLTNGSPSLQKTKLQLTPELNEYFNEIVISGDVGVGKPNRKIFDYAMSLLSVQNDEVIMVGDNLMTDILGASRVGMKSVWINRKGKSYEDVVPTYEIRKLSELPPLLRTLS